MRIKVTFPAKASLSAYEPPPCRVPESCPTGFQRYTVVAGDTIFEIAQRLGIDYQLIIDNNPHIPDPDLIYPEDELCVPSRLALPCCFFLSRRYDALSPDAIGSVIVQRLANGQNEITGVVVNVPSPTTFGEFVDIYEGVIVTPGIGESIFNLLPAGYESRIWVGRRPVSFLTPESQLYIRTGSTQTAVEAPVTIFEGSIGICQ